MHESMKRLCEAIVQSDASDMSIPPVMMGLVNEQGVPVSCEQIKLKEMFQRPIKTKPDSQGLHKINLNVQIPDTCIQKIQGLGEKESLSIEEVCRRLLIVGFNEYFQE